MSQSAPAAGHYEPHLGHDEPPQKHQMYTPDCPVDDTNGFLGLSYVVYKVCINIQLIYPML